MAPLLDIQDLRTWFPIHRGIVSRTVGHVRAVDGVSLQVSPGETLALVGESGCGKTTLARTVLRLDPARTGRVMFEGLDLVTAPEKAVRPLRRKLQIVFQDPFSSLNPRMTVLDIVTEGLVQHRVIRRADKESEAGRLLGDVGLGTDALHRYPHEFSGGQRQRISIARAISLRPKLVICDEPVSALDVSVQAQVINLLKDLRDEYGLSYIFISHDISVVRQIADRVAVMYLGQIVEEGPAADVVGRPRHPYTRALISAVPKVGGDRRHRVILEGDVPSPAHPPKACRFHPRCSFAQESCRRVEPPLTPPDDDPDRPVACLRKNEI